MAIPEIPDGVFNIIRIIIQLAFIFTLITFSIYGIIVFFKYRKNKDEKVRLMFIKSLAQSFIILIILQAIKVFIIDFVYAAWGIALLPTGIEIDPLGISFIILGVIFTVNKQKAGSKKTKNDERITGDNYE